MKMASIMMMLFLFSIFYKGICIFLYSHSRNYNLKLPRRIVFIHQSSTFSNLNLIILSGFIVLFSVSSSAWAENTSRIELTREEQAWLDRHPNIILGSTAEYPPMVIKKEDGIHIGILVDLFEQINQRLNTKIRLEIGNWVDIQDKAQQKKLDGLAMGTASLGRNTLYNSTDVIMSTYNSVFARTNNEYQFKQFSDLKGLRVGYKKGAQASRNLLEKHTENLKIPFDTHESMTQALLSKDIDVIVAWMSYDHWRKDKLQGTIDNVFLIDEYPIEIVTYIRKDWPELIPILNKAIKSIQQKEMAWNTNKWFGQWPQYQSARVNLTLEEQAWLENNHTVRVSVGDIPPWSINSPVPQGMSVEYLKVIGEQFGINFKFIPDYHQRGEPFKDIAAEHHSFDLYPTVLNTPERKDILSMSDNYLESPLVIFTREKTVDVFNIEDLRRRKVSVERGHVMQNQLKTEVDGIQLIIKENIQKALIALSTGEVDAYVGNLIVTSYMLQRLGINNIKISSPTSFGLERRAMVTRQEWSPLISIINKGLLHITEAQKMSIRNKYLAIHYDHGITSIEVLKWGSFLIVFVFGIIILFVIWSRTLKQRVIQRTNELSESESRFRSIFEQAAVGICHLSTDGQFLRLNKKFCDIVGYSEEELIKKHFQDITHKDDLQTDLELHHKLLDGDCDFYTLEKRYVHKDSSTVWVNLTVKLIRNKENTPKWFVSVIEDISNRKLVEQKVFDYQQRLKAQATQLTLVEEQERRKIATDLHDNVGQSLALSRLQLTVVSKAIDNPAAKKQLDELSQTLLQAVRDTRQLIFELSSPTLQELGLGPAISEWIEHHLANLDLDVEVVDKIQMNCLNIDQNMILFRSVRELLTNILKHAIADKISVLLGQDNNNVIITVSDNGVGFNPEQAKQSVTKEGGLGLFSIKERLSELGGDMLINSRTHFGTTIILTIPCKELEKV